MKYTKLSTIGLCFVRRLKSKLVIRMCLDLENDCVLCFDSGTNQILITTYSFSSIENAYFDIYHI